jgi:vacuolar-type H+-ATPase subunit I/STV1
MTKKLEELFNLEDAAAPVIEPTSIVKTHDEVNSLNDSYKAVEEITRGLPQIKELDNLDDAELDGLAVKAEKAYDDLMDLGMNVEVRYASRIFEVASSMMGNAITAKTAKIDKKLKAIDLQMKKYKIDKDNNEDPNDVINGQGYIITDRNELLKKLGQKD